MLATMFDDQGCRATAASRDGDQRGIVHLCGMRTRSPGMIRAFDLVQRFARIDDAPLLIHGETGTGKELVARAVHDLSGRARKPFVVVDCAALPPSIAESELFGHERGAFTGADRPYAGRIAAAEGGTLFLDEVNSLPLAVQGMLLRFLESGECSRIGQQRPSRIDVKLIAATNQALEDLIGTGQMRSDFFHRLDVLRIELPALRERMEDLQLLVEDIVAREPIARQLGVTGIPPEIVARLVTHDFPGNVRELRNMLRRLMVLGPEGSPLTWREAPAAPSARPPAPSQPPPLGNFRLWMQQCERQYLGQLVERFATSGERCIVSGMPERTLHRKLRTLRVLDAARAITNGPCATT